MMLGPVPVDLALIESMRDLYGSPDPLGASNGMGMIVSGYASEEEPTARGEMRAERSLSPTLRMKTSSMALMITTYNTTNYVLMSLRKVVYAKSTLSPSRASAGCLQPGLFGRFRSICELTAHRSRKFDLFVC